MMIGSDTVAGAEDLLVEGDGAAGVGHHQVRGDGVRPLGDVGGSQDMDPPGVEVVDGG